MIAIDKKEIRARKATLENCKAHLIINRYQKY